LHVGRKNLSNETNEHPILNISTRYPKQPIKARILPLKTLSTSFMSNMQQLYLDFAKYFFWNIGLAKVGLFRMEQKLFFGVI